MHAIYSHTENTYIHTNESKHSEMGPVRQNPILGTVKGKERKSIYIAPFCTKVHTKRSGMDHTVLPANNIMPAFPLWHSPDVTTTSTEAADIQLQLTTHLSTPKG